MGRGGRGEGQLLLLLWAERGQWPGRAGPVRAGIGGAVAVAVALQWCSPHHMPCCSCSCMPCSTGRATVADCAVADCLRPSVCAAGHAAGGSAERRHLPPGAALPVWPVWRAARGACGWQAWPGCPSPAPAPAPAPALRGWPGCVCLRPAARVVWLVAPCAPGGGRRRSHTSSAGVLPFPSMRCADARLLPRCLAPRRCATTPCAPAASCSSSTTRGTRVGGGWVAPGVLPGCLPALPGLPLRAGAARPVAGAGVRQGAAAGAATRRRGVGLRPRRSPPSH